MLGINISGLLKNRKNCTAISCINILYRQTWEVGSHNDAAHGGPDDDYAKDPKDPRGLLTHARWLPAPEDDKDRQPLLFVESSSVFLVADVGEERRRKRMFPISPQGEEGVVSHGLPDWIYEGGLIERLKNTLPLLFKKLKFC